MRALLRNRKGQSDDDNGGFDFLVGAAIAVVLLLVIVVLYNTIFNQTKDVPDEQRCRTSIATASKVTYASAGELNSSITCSPKHVTVDGANEDAAKREFAEALRFCSERWRAANGELFTKDGVYCNPCVFLDLQGGDGLRDFDRYLSTEKAPRTSVTYAHYLTVRESEFAGESTTVPVENPGSPTLLATDQEYVVLFVYAKGKSTQALRDHFSRNVRYNVKEIGKSAGIGGALGAVGGAAAAVFIVGTGGVGAVVIGAVGLVAGATSGGLLEYFNGDVKIPEWINTIVLIPNDADAFTSLHCTAANQASPGDPIDV